MVDFILTHYEKVNISQAFGYFFAKTRNFMNSLKNIFDFSSRAG